MFQEEEVQLRSSKAQLLPPETGGKSCALDERSCTLSPSLGSSRHQETSDLEMDSNHLEMDSKPSGYGL